MTTQRARPILMSGPMVRAILEGRKTVTRRIVTPQSMFDGKDAIVRQFPNQHGSPFGVPGDLLWVRETWCSSTPGIVGYAANAECGAWLDCGGERIWNRHGFILEAPAYRESFREPASTFSLSCYGGKWRPSIHMPRWASRLTLEVVSVRVERVQEITEEDALREGVTIRPDAEIAARIAGDTPARMEFWHLWESIHGPGAWERNDWVWRVEFRRLEADHAD